VAGWKILQRREAPWSAGARHGPQRQTPSTRTKPRARQAATRSCRLAAGVGRAPIHGCRKPIAAIPPIDFRRVIR